MRMWNVDCNLMCGKHLLGEHVECHMFVGSIKKNISIKGYVEKGLIQTSLLSSRHKELVEEMKRRGWNHRSKLSYRDKLSQGRIKRNENIKELSKRCKDCRKIIIKSYNGGKKGVIR